MPKYLSELVSPTSLVLLQPLLAALGATDTAILKPTSSLPAPCFRVRHIQTIVCATPVNTLPIFRAAMVAAAATDNLDVIVVRHGFHPEMLDDVIIDVVTGRTRPVRMLWSLARYEGADGSCWLVPSDDGAGPSVRLDADGLTTTAEPPYADFDERGDGLSCAARRTVWALRAMRRS